jgi:hypothetical protein
MAKFTITSETDGYSDCIELQSTATWKDGGSGKFNFNILLEIPMHLYNQKYTEINIKSLSKCRKNSGIIIVHWFMSIINRLNWYWQTTVYLFCIPTCKDFFTSLFSWSLSTCQIRGTELTWCKIFGYAGHFRNTRLWIHLWGNLNPGIFF